MFVVVWIGFVLALGLSLAGVLWAARREWGEGAAERVDWDRFLRDASCWSALRELTPSDTADDG
jgi:hypothetical protein